MPQVSKQAISPRQRDAQDPPAADAVEPGLEPLEPLEPVEAVEPEEPVDAVDPEFEPERPVRPERPLSLPVWAPT